MFCIQARARLVRERVRSLTGRVKAHKPTSVRHAVVGNFTSSGEQSLVLACVFPPASVEPRVSACALSRPQRAAARLLPFLRANSTRRKSTRLEIHLLTPDGLQVPATILLSRLSLTRCLRAAHCGRSHFWAHCSHPPLSTARASALATPHFFITAGA